MKFVINAVLTILMAPFALVFLLGEALVKWASGFRNMWGLAGMTEKEIEIADRFDENN